MKKQSDTPLEQKKKFISLENLKYYKASTTQQQKNDSFLVDDIEKTGL